MTTVKRQLLAVVGAAAFASAAHATIDFDVTGLAGTGVTADVTAHVTAHVTFTYTHTSATDGSLTFAIENTTAVGGRISGFAFNIPTIAGTTFMTIADVSDGSGIIALGPPPSTVIPENSSSNQTGWYGLWEFDGIKTPTGGGDFDFGILNDGQNVNKFITDGVGKGPLIENTDNSNDSTTFTLNIVGTGLNTGDSAIEQAIASALSVPKDGNPSGYTFGVRFQGIPTGDSDFATTTTAVVPAPGAAALAAFGLGIVGWVHRRRAAPWVSTTALP